jgi:predicted aspartyl protease
MRHKAITLQSSVGRLWEIITDVGVAEAIEADLVGTQSLRTFWSTCLWDTGASHSSISKEAAEALGIKPFGEITVLSAQGEAVENCYLVSLNLPDLLFLPSVRVTECASNDIFGVIIGMDIISQGDFAITNVNGIATFSFCVPGIETIDYVQRIARWNV